MTKEERVEQVVASFDEINALYINKVASQIAEIGKMSQASINLYTEMMQVAVNVAALNAELAKAVKMSRQELREVFQAAAEDVYTDKRFERALTEEPLTDTQKARIERLTEEITRQTDETMQNLSNTTSISSTYRQAIDQAVLAASNGEVDYLSAMRRTISQIGSEGAKVEYESGYHRRLDTAVRQNITNALAQLSQQGAEILGEELGYNAVEISAHAMPAEDHEAVQGHVFLKAEFEKMQNGQDCVDVDGHKYIGFRRPIGEWNCGHIASPFDTRISTRKYTDEQLAQIIKKNHDGCTIGGRKVTMYRASQEMREIETEIRKCKGEIVAARAAGDEVLEKQKISELKELISTYRYVSKASGLKMRSDRTYVAGY